MLENGANHWLAINTVKKDLRKELHRANTRKETDKAHRAPSQIGQDLS